MPEITWYHNGKVVYDNPDFRTSYNKETGEVTLFIVEVFPQDTGAYECVGVNKYGRAETRAQLLVEGGWDGRICEYLNKFYIVDVNRGW